MALGLVTSIFDSSAPTAEQQGELISNTAEMVTNALSKLPTSISGKEEIVSRLTESLVKLKLESAYRIAGWQFFLCLGIAFALGLVIAFCYMIKNDFSKSLVFTLALMPPIVCVLIMLVSGSMGAAIAVGGVFALTRFRSATGTSRELVQILLAMATGLTLGLGYIWIALILVVAVEAVSIIFTFTHFGESSKLRRTLKITIPEELDYTGLFDDLFKKYTTRAVLVKVKLKNLGTLFQLTYDVVLKNQAEEKQFIDEIRVRNANLDILCSKVIANPDNL
ncbi:MAG: DUF4956 domain-containing protein [Clostridia bacterium]|nr:DUF4956 domain-containing protein [Clostridia bacterium]